MKIQIKNNVSFVGYVDFELETFHGEDYSINHGSSQNSYIIEEEKTILIDTVWVNNSDYYLENLKKEIDLKKIDFIVLNHSECDHSGALENLMKEIPNVPIYLTDLAKKSIEGQFGKKPWDFRIVKTGDRIDIGNSKELVFIEMKMLHWPDSMATYLTGDNILFSNDAFGEHYACMELFNDKADQNILYLEAMKYFVNIINPFSSLVIKKIDEIKSLNLKIDIIAPSHGVIWRDNPMQIVNKYIEWSSNYYENQVSIVYETMWNGTKKIAHKIAEYINNFDKNIVVKVFNISKDDKNDIMTEIFKSRAVLVGSPTCMNDILSHMSGILTFLKCLKFKSKKAATFGCYGWSGENINILKNKLKEAGFTVIEESIKPLYNPKEEDYKILPSLVEKLLN